MVTLVFCFRMCPVLSLVLHRCPFPRPRHLIFSSIYPLLLEFFSFTFRSFSCSLPLQQKLTSPSRHPRTVSSHSVFTCRFLGGWFVFSTRGGGLLEGALRGRSSALCTLSRALEYWLAETRADTTVKVTAGGAGGGVLIDERSCFQKKPPVWRKQGCLQQKLFVCCCALLTAVASTHLLVWKFPPPLVGASPHQRAFVIFFFRPRWAKKLKVTKVETPEEKKKWGKKSPKR